MHRLVTSPVSKFKTEENNTMTTQKDPMVALVDELEQEKLNAEEQKKQLEEKQKQDAIKKTAAFAKNVAERMFGASKLDDVAGVTKVTPVGPSDVRFIMNGQNVSVSFEPQMYKSGWRSKPTGKTLLIVRVGYEFTSEGKRRFPENSKGGFNWSKAKDFVVETSKGLQTRQKHEMSKEVKYKKALAAAEQINLAKGCAVEEKVSWGSGRYISTKRAFIKATEYGDYVVEMPKNLTLEQAEKILDLCISMGLHESQKY